MIDHVVRTALVLLIGLSCTSAKAQTTLAERNAELLRQLQEVHGLSPAQMDKIRAIFANSRIIGQGNPAITQHPVTPEQCQAKLKQQGVAYDNPRFEKICGAKYMAPLYDPATQRPEDAKACIDQFEFPDIPCAYPVVWMKAREAAQVCEAVGKRLCDAHEWEGACDGAPSLRTIALTWPDACPPKPFIACARPTIWLTPPTSGGATARLRTRDVRDGR